MPGQQIAYIDSYGNLPVACTGGRAFLHVGAARAMPSQVINETSQETPGLS